ncbi:hypothetical protein D3C77_581870 [compost metagenome]
MGLINQLAQLFRCAVAVLWGEGHDPVVAPIAFTGALSQGHQFDGRHPQGRQPR